MIQALIGPIANLASSWMDNRAEQTKSKGHIAKAKAEAEAKVLVSSATSVAEWEKIMAQASDNSWKDEYLVILFSLPLILSFAGEWGRDIVTDGFEALSGMPEWYQLSLGSIVAASFAIRGATKFFGKK